MKDRNGIERLGPIRPPFVNVLVCFSPCPVSSADCGVVYFREFHAVRTPRGIESSSMTTISMTSSAMSERYDITP